MSAGSQVGAGTVEHVPHQNRATPWGTVIANPGRGLFFGNRGNLHDASGAIVRRWKARAWVTCLLEFKGRRRAPLLQPGRYTELFFLDEAAAMAAGRRPCGECRRNDLARFKQAWTAAFPDDASLADIDRRLHHDRIGPDRGKRTFEAPCAGLSDGAYIDLDGSAWLISGESLHRWSPGGYLDRRDRPGSERVQVLTPRCTVAVLAAGYRPVLHLSARAAAER